MTGAEQERPCPYTGTSKSPLRPPRTAYAACALLVGSPARTARPSTASHGRHIPWDKTSSSRVGVVRGGLSNTTPHSLAPRCVRLSSLRAVWTKYIFVAEDDFRHSLLRVEVDPRILSLRELVYLSASAPRRARTRTVREERDLRPFARFHGKPPPRCRPRALAPRPPTAPRRMRTPAHLPVRPPLGAAPLRAVERRGHRARGSRPWGHRREDGRGTRRRRVGRLRELGGTLVAPGCVCASSFSAIGGENIWRCLGDFMRFRGAHGRKSHRIAHRASSLGPPAA